MLKKLRIRFILVNMLLVGVALALMFGAVFALTYRSERGQIDRAIEKILSDRRPMDREQNLPRGEEGSEPPEGIEPPEDMAADDRDVRLPYMGRDEEISYVYTVTVRVLPDGSYLREDIFGADMDDEILSTAVETVLSTEKTSGSIASLHLEWRKSVEGGGTRIVFASTDHLHEALRSTALISGAVTLASLALFLALSYLLSGIAIRPVARAWDQQKQFVADASHDLKTPLTVILANSDILRAHPEETVADQMQWVEGTAEEAERMRGLVDEMLELARSEDLNRRPALSELPLSDLCEGTVLQFEPIAFEKGVRLESNVQSDVRALCHEETFVRLAHILIDNAIKYSPAGDAVTVTLQNPTRNTVQFSVKNGGTPISPEDLPHLFERFYRADKARTVGGHGLGLSIAKNLAESLGGKIAVRSDAESGTVFTVTLQAAP